MTRHTDETKENEDVTMMDTLDYEGVEKTGILQILLWNNSGNAWAWPPALAFLYSRETLNLLINFRIHRRNFQKMYKARTGKNLPIDMQLITIQQRHKEVSKKTKKFLAKWISRHSVGNN